MNFIQALNTYTPLALQPDPPASKHAISYDLIQFTQYSSQIQRQKEYELASQIDKCSDLLKNKDKQAEQRNLKYLERQLLFQIQNDRLRNILKEWQHQRRKHQEEVKIKEGIYQIKLEEVKRQMENYYAQELARIRSENKGDLQRIKELYNIRIAKVNEEANKEDFKATSMQIENKRLKTQLQISDGEISDLQARLSMRQGKLSEKIQQISELQQGIRRLKDENQQFIQSKGRQIQRYREQSFKLNGQNEQLVKKHESISQTIKLLRQNEQELQLNKQRLLDRIKALQIKCEGLEQQIEKFSFRKTQQNRNGSISQQYIMSVPHIQQSHMSIVQSQISSTTKNKSKFKDEMGANNEMYKLQLKEIREEFSSRQRQLQEKIQRLQNTVKRVEEQVAEKQKNVKECQEKMFSLKSEFVEKQQKWLDKLMQVQRSYEKLNQEWLKKERQMSGLFKTIESTYLRKMNQMEQALKMSQSCLNEAKIKLANCQKQKNDINNLLFEKIKQMSERPGK